MIGRVAKIKAALKVSGTTLNDDVGNNVAYPRVPTKWPNSVPLLVVSIADGTRPPSASMNRTEFLVAIYGGSSDYDVVTALFDKLHDWCYQVIPAGSLKAWQTITGIEKVVILSDFSGGDDPEEGWPVHFARLGVLYST